MQQAIAHAKVESAKPNNPFTLTDALIEAICAEAAFSATEILYRLSGKQFAGQCGPVTIRPVARPVDADSRGFMRRNRSYGGYGSTSTMSMGMAPVVSQYGPAYPPEIILSDFPVRSIELVKIDGVVIPPDEYELREFQRLVRLRPTTSSVPTDRWGWPTSQIPDLPDTEVGTFSITYTFGADPGIGGRMAAIALAESFALPKLGDTSRYPTRVSSFTRQGVAAQVVSPIDMVSKGMTGVVEADTWLMTVNPTKARRQAQVWSPDVQSNRRQSNVTNN
jgi:hypothetical protein